MRVNKNRYLGRCNFESVACSADVGNEIINSLLCFRFWAILLVQQLQLLRHYLLHLLRPEARVFWASSGKLYEHAIGIIQGMDHGVQLFFEVRKNLFFIFSQLYLFLHLFKILCVPITSNLLKVSQRRIAQ